MNKKQKQKTLWSPPENIRADRHLQRHRRTQTAYRHQELLWSWGCTQQQVMEHCLPCMKSWVQFPGRHKRPGGAHLNLSLQMETVGSEVWGHLTLIWGLAWLHKALSQTISSVFFFFDANNKFTENELGKKNFVHSCFSEINSGEWVEGERVVGMHPIHVWDQVLRNKIY